MRPRDQTVKSGRDDEHDERHDDEQHEALSATKSLRRAGGHPVDERAEEAEQRELACRGDEAKR